MTDRKQAEIILGARIYIARMDATVGANKVTPATLPSPPTADNPGPWVSLGKVRTAKVQTDFKTADVEGVADDGLYKITELKLATKRKLQFSTNDITPEALELTFGLSEAIKDGSEQILFGSGTHTIECWVYMDMTDAYRQGVELAHMSMQSRLTLTNPLEAKSDPALAEYELAIVANPLSKFAPVAIAPAPTA